MPYSSKKGVPALIVRQKKSGSQKKLSCTRPVLPPVCPCVGFCRQGWNCIPLRAFCGLLGKCELSPQRMEKTLIRAGCGGWIAGSKSVQVKGRVALKSPLARFTPPGKAVRGFLLPPGKSRF